jgi:hypothetical protein
MDAYESLRQEAAKKRDEIIAGARIEYQHALWKLRELRRTLNGQDPRAAMRVKRRPLLALTRELLPHDRTFTISEVVELLSQGEPDRTVYSATVRTFFVRFEEQGLIHRVRRCKGRVLWATADSGVPESPYGALPITDVAGEIIQETGPLKGAELVIAMHERGYRTDTTQRGLYRTLESSLSKSPLFRKEDGKWLFLLDFAKCHLDTAPEFSEEKWSEWNEQGIERFGAERWKEAKIVVAALKRFGVYYYDMQQGNLMFADSEHIDDS